MFVLPTTMTVAFVALAIERFLGFPSPLRKVFGKPESWLARAVGVFAFLLPGEAAPAPLRWTMDAVFTCLATGAIVALSWLFVSWLRPIGYAWCWEALLATPFMAQYALRVRTRAVITAMTQHDDDAITSTVTTIAPDSPEPEDTAQAVRRTAEAMASGLVYNVMTPVFWLALFGLPGILGVAALSAARNRCGSDAATSAFARALLHAIRFLPCKLAGLVITGAASMLSPSAGARAMEHIYADTALDNTRDANWARAAFAGVLNMRLAGPEVAGQTRRTDHWIGNGTREPDITNLRAALRLLATTLTLLTLLMGLGAAFA